MHHLTEILALLITLGIGAQWLGWRLQIPAIVLLSLLGLIIGPVLGILRPSEALGDAYPALIKLAVAAILFEGGLSLRLSELKQAAAGVNRLITIAVVLVLSFSAIAAHFIAGLAWPVALIFGAITVVTGPTVILPLLRSTRLLKRPASYLKWEGIVNDPVGAVLVVVIFEYFVGADAGLLDDTLLHLASGAGAALVLGGLSGWLLGRAFLSGQVPEYLKGPVALAAALGVYAIANLVLEDAGLIAATLMGVVLGNMDLPSIGELRRFKEYIAVLLVSGIFLMLTADLDPHIMLALDWRSGALIAAVILLVRPLAIWLATIGAGMSWQERALVGWIAPRGVVAAAVAGVFGPALAEQGFKGAELLLPLVFVLILSTVVLHGFSLGWLARRLNLSAKNRGGLIISSGTAWSSGLAVALHKQQVPVIIADTAWHRLRRARLSGVPVFFGELLSEHAENALELGAYGSLLATGNNDAYNALVCAHYAPELGRQKVFQLAADDLAEQRRRLSPSARGRIAIAEDVQYEDLQRHWYQDWSFHTSKLTEEFGVAQLRDALPAKAILVLVIDARANVRLIEAGKPLQAVSGERVLWFGCKQRGAGDCNQQEQDFSPAEEPRPLV